MCIYLYVPTPPLSLGKLKTYHIKESYYIFSSFIHFMVICPGGIHRIASSLLFFHYAIPYQEGLVWGSFFVF